MCHEGRFGADYVQLRGALTMLCIDGNTFTGDEQTITARKRIRVNTQE